MPFLLAEEKKHIFYSSFLYNFNESGADVKKHFKLNYFLIRYIFMELPKYVVWINHSNIPQREMKVHRIEREANLVIEPLQRL